MRFQLVFYHPGVPTQKGTWPYAIWRETEDPAPVQVWLPPKQKGRYWELELQGERLRLCEGSRALFGRGKLIVTLANDDDVTSPLDRIHYSGSLSTEEAEMRFIKALADPTALITEMTKL